MVIFLMQSGNTALSLANGHKDIKALLNPSSLAKELCDNACSGKEYLVKKCIANGANVDGYRDAVREASHVSTLKFI